jgi:flagellar P-ring protein precursor FlgI
MGFVVGLAGKGDSPGAVRAVYTPDERFRADVDARNFALVAVTAQIPAGLKPGQRFPVQIAAAGDCASLAGGMLVTTPLRTASPGVAIGAAASGRVIVDPTNPTAGEIADGGALEKAP